MKTRIVSTVLLYLCLSVPIAFADEHHAEVSTKNNKTYTFEAITVTATKTKADVQDIPASIDVLDKDDVADTGSRALADVLPYLPNVLGNCNYGINKIVFRGMKSPDSMLFESSGFYVDDVNYLIPELRNPDLFSVERIEVLKGPQGTLYGGNSETGVINIVTRKPENALSGEITGGYGSFNSAFATAEVGAPLIEDELFFNLAVAQRTSDGYMKNEHTGDYASGLEHQNIRGAMRWRASDSLSMDLTVAAFQFNDQDGSFRLENGPGSTDPYRIDWNGDNRNDRRGDSQALRMENTGDGARFVSITTRSSSSSRYDGDGDLTAAATNQLTYHLDKNFDAFTQEFRLASPEGNAPWQWLLGAYGMVQSTDFDKLLDSPSYYGLPYAQIRTSEVDSQNAAVFGQTTYTFLGRLHLTGGLRLEHTQLQGKQNYTMVYGVTSSKRFKEHLYETEMLPTVSLAWDFAESHMLYTTISRGSLVGGFNTGFGNSKEQFVYDPEHMWNYEAGIKTSWMEDRLQVNAAAFWQEVTDKQVTKVVGNDRWIDNADAARSRGLEVEIKARPTMGLDLFAGLGFLDATTTNWSVAGYDYKGKTLPFAPKHSFNAGGEYHHASGLFGRLDMTGLTAFYTDPENEYECGGYQLYNARFGYETEEWTIALWCKNIFDREYVTDKREWSLGQTAVVDGAPRSLGVDVSWTF